VRHGKQKERGEENGKHGARELRRPPGW